MKLKDEIGEREDKMRRFLMILKEFFGIFREKEIHINGERDEIEGEGKKGGGNDERDRSGL